MSHHGFNDERRGAMSDMMKKIMGEHPDGKLNPDDAGAVAMSVSVEEGRIRMDFPKAVMWIAFTPDEAMGLAEVLVKHARAAGSTKPLTLRVG